MLDRIFLSVLVGEGAAISAQSFALCTMVSALCGLACAFVYMYRHRYSKSFVVTLALLPIIVQMVILLVNGNLGAGIAVMGVFNLVRFRSIAGTAKDIGSVFLAMAIGLATGMGYLGLALVLTLVVGLLNIVYVSSSLGREKESLKRLKITVPEDLEFEGLFNEVLARHTQEYELQRVETSNMGSLYQLEYAVRMDQSASEKRMLDELRCLNGNLKVSLGLFTTEKETL